MEEQKREKLQQLIQKNKEEQSEHPAPFSSLHFVFLRSQKSRRLALPLSHRLHFLLKLGISRVSEFKVQVNTGMLGRQAFFLL